MSRKAMTLPKYLLTCRTSRSGIAELMASPSTPGVLGTPSHERVHADGKEKNHAEERVVPVGIQVGEDDPDLRKADDQGADGRADGGAVSAGQQTAANHGGDDEEELLTNAPAG